VASAPDDPATHPRLAVIAAGHRGDVGSARAALGDADPGVYTAALTALARAGALTTADVVDALHDGPPPVRRRAAELAAGVTGRGSRSALPVALRAALADADPLVAEASCFALGERRDRAAIGDLAEVAHAHPDTRCREAAVAALGAIGDPAGLAAVVAALDDKPTVRRRATVALAAFAGPEAAAAMRRSLEDRDWQVREVAEILLGEPPG
jgi:HEAT repeat protein